MYILTLNQNKIKLPLKLIGKMNIKDGDSLIGEFKDGKLIISVADNEEDEESEDDSDSDQPMQQVVNAIKKMGVEPDRDMSDSIQMPKSPNLDNETTNVSEDIFKGLKINPLANKKVNAYISNAEDINEFKQKEKQQEKLEKSSTDTVHWVNGNLVHSEPKEIETKPKEHKGFTINPKKVTKRPPTIAELFKPKSTKTESSSIPNVDEISINTNKKLQTDNSNNISNEDNNNYSSTINTINRNELPDFDKDDIIGFRQASTIIQDWDCGRCGKLADYKSTIMLNGKLLCKDCTNDLKEKLINENKLKIHNVN